MDINTLLDFTEELLNMYGYETRRNVGVIGGKVITAELEHELGTLEEKKLPKKGEEGTVYKADILAEKKDIERPFGRIVVRYKRGHEPVSPSDVKQLQAIVNAAQAYSGLLLSVTGYTPEAKEVSLTLGKTTIMTPEQVQTLMGKAMSKEKWWFNAPAYPIKIDYAKAMERAEWYYEKMLLQSSKCIWYWNKELAYEPYWKFSYHIAPKGGKKGMHEGFFAINAFNGEVDVWSEIAPEKDPNHELRDAYVDKEAINMVERLHIAPRARIKKPKLPKGVNYVVYRPAMEKHEAKLAATQWISYIEGVKPEDVVVTGRELIYYPWWKIFYFYRPIVKNAWLDTEYTGFKISAVLGYVYNQWKSAYPAFRRDIIYYYMERSLIKLFGVDRYVRWMRKITYAITVLWWDYHIILKPWHIWAMLMFVTGGTIYFFLTAAWGWSIVFGLLLIFIFMGPGYAFLYLIQDYLKRYPTPFGYPHPTLTKKDWKRKLKPKEEARAAYDELEALQAAEKLTPHEARQFTKLKEKRTKELIKASKKKKKWWKIR